MERYRPMHLLTVLVTAACLAGCSSAPPLETVAGPPETPSEAKAVHENAENNLAFAKDQASLWLESQEDRCATADVVDREACAAAAKASYREQVAQAQRRHDEICRKADRDLAAAFSQDN